MKKLMIPFMIALFCMTCTAGCSSSNSSTFNPSDKNASSYNAAGSMHTDKHPKKQIKFRGRTAGGSAANQRTIRWKD